MSRDLATRALLVLAVSAPAVAARAQEQQPPPPVVQAQPMQAPQPQTMRWTLANGQVFDGYEVGGDANFVMIQTPAGVMQVPRNQVVSAVPVAGASVMVSATPA